MDRPTIDPLPPVAEACALPWDAPLTDPVRSLADARAALGDTFVVDSGDDRYLFTFAPVGVASFYGLVEEQASKGVADWRMLRRKLPDEVFVDRRTLPHQLFGREDVGRFLANVDRALDDTVAELGDRGSVDVFTLTRRLGHRIGLASWGGPGATAGSRFEALIAAFDVLDGSDAFVHPDAMAAVAASGKAAEIAALETIADQLAPSLDGLPGNEDEHPLFARLVARWSDEPAATAARGVAGDVALIHVASMSNLFAALGWALVDLFAHPEEATEVAAGDRTAAESCALESIRLAQRSIMSRYVLQPLTFDVGGTVHEVAPGTTISTLLPLTNTSSAPGLEDWDPARWRGRRLGDASALAAVELVTSFGHGRHTCPAQPFSLATMATALQRLLSVYRWTPQWTASPLPVRAQIGGVARAGAACPVAYERTADSAAETGVGAGQ